jgi:hypothetical protein
MWYVIIIIIISNPGAGKHLGLSAFGFDIDRDFM